MLKPSDSRRWPLDGVEGFRKKMFLAHSLTNINGRPYTLAGLDRVLDISFLHWHCHYDTGRHCPRTLPSWSFAFVGQGFSHCDQSFLQKKDRNKAALIFCHLPIWNWSLATSVSAPSFSFGSEPIVCWLVWDIMHSPTERHHFDWRTECFILYRIQDLSCDHRFPSVPWCFGTSRARHRQCEGRAGHLLLPKVADLDWLIGWLTLIDWLIDLH